MNFFIRFSRRRSDKRSVLSSKGEIGRMFNSRSATGTAHRSVKYDIYPVDWAGDVADQDSDFGE